MDTRQALPGVAAFFQFKAHAIHQRQVQAAQLALVVARIEIVERAAGLKFPKLITPQWVGEEGVDAVVILAREDWKAALDCTVIMQGVFSMVFHPHGWIKAEQVVDCIDYAQTKYGTRVKFLNFREALARLKCPCIDVIDSSFFQIVHFLH